jgi:tetratricopeptide (TPR) repeat protein
MAQTVTCAECGDQNFPTDAICLSCGADLRPAFRSGAAEAPPTPAPALDDPVHGITDEATRHARERRAERIEELRTQVDSLIAQGFHKLPKEPGSRYGPADDVSDLCREIGECYARNENPEEAARWFERALAISGDNVPARAYLVGTLCRLGRYDEAKVSCEETPGDPIDKNVVRAWLDVPEGFDEVRIGPRLRRVTLRPERRAPQAALARRIVPSGARPLAVLVEPRSA